MSNVHNIEQGCTDYTFEIGEHRFRASFLCHFQMIVWTNITTGVGDEIKLTRPFASKTPHESLVRNEVVNHLDELELLKSDQT
ncbi:hypothetical protein HL13_gp81 [Dinoroseobacter phage DFL12phi1]|uniref:Uncharacterized protein n=2 Tax=Baltimorevirus DFL12 TaxID=2169868 RepID=A0A023NGP5_9CAUD|nr:hypothetical protein HL13_gp81 [Dinoroseobacter phage DFL12phi1]AHX01041.1 hypothetical protein DFL12P1_0081 [Dinoroseobacter phage DFL12phi1]AID16820.1 hypothetical protein vBDshPR2C_04 [Dinoroseobacter phage vBDshPR2C]